VKNRIELEELAQSIIDRRKFSVMTHDTIAVYDNSIEDLPDQLQAFSGKISASFEIENSEKPEKIADALYDVKEQMLVWDNHKPEMFIWDVSLEEDDTRFGFVKISQKNRLTKFSIDLSFKRATDHFFEYFLNRLSVPKSNISQLSKKEA